MRFSYSNIQLFRQCPLKWFYKYREGLGEPETPALVAGKMFHEVAELYYSGKTYAHIFEEYEKLVGSGFFENDKSLLEDTFALYLEHYRASDAKEKIIGVEEEIEVPFEDDDTFIGIIDRIVEIGTMIVVRDTKTTFRPLKYRTEDVRYSPQFLTYDALVEYKHAIKVGAVEVDEVRIARLDKVPINKNGMPSADMRRLSLVTYEEYYKKLVDMGIEDVPPYDGVLEQLKKRGHPLFQRIRVPMLDKSLVDSALNDVRATYRLIKHALANEEEVPFPRHRSPLCNYCGLKGLCELDHFTPTDHEREIVMGKNNIKKVDK